MNRKRATHNIWGEVDVLAGPVSIQTHEGAEFFYWIDRDDYKRPITAPSDGITFPPHQEYWLLHFTTARAPAFYRHLDVAELANNKWADHITHHWQQKENGPWQVEIVEVGDE